MGQLAVEDQRGFVFSGMLLLLLLLMWLPWEDPEFMEERLPNWEPPSEVGPCLGDFLVKSGMIDWDWIVSSISPWAGEPFLVLGHVVLDGYLALDPVTDLCA